MTVVLNAQIAGGGSSNALASAGVLSWNADTGLSRVSAGEVGVGTGAAGSIAGTLNATTLKCGAGVIIQAGANGITLTDSSAKIQSGGSFKLMPGTGTGETWVEGYATELLTLSTGGTTTDTTANLLPAGAIIEAVVARVTTTITTATSWQLGDPTTAGRFTAANSTMVAGTTDIGILHWSGAVSTLAAGPSQAAAAKVRVTTVGTPGAGAIRITVFYRTFSAPTS